MRLSLWAPVALGAGIAMYFAWPAQPAPWFLWVVLVLAAALQLLALRLPVYRWPVTALVLLLLGMALGDANVRFAGTPMLARDLGTREVVGTVRDIQPQAEGLRLIIDVDTIEGIDAASKPQRVRLTHRIRAAAPEIGAKAACRARLMAISPPVLPGGYDFRRHNYFNGIGATGFIVGACTVLQPADTSTVAQKASSLRQSIRTDVDSVLDGDAAAITEALLTGVQQGISEPTMEAMRISGLVHILSVSGLHIGLAAGIVFFSLRALLALVPFIALRLPIKKIAAAAALLSALAYTVLVGAPIPAVRSLLMTALVLLAVMLDRQALSLRLVAVAAIGVLVLYPSSILSPSFQMSFAAITAIMALIEGTENARQNWLQQQAWLTRAVVYTAATMATSLAATLATMPFTYYHFQQLNAYGVIANMLAMPLASFWLMPLAVLAFLAMPFGLQAYPLQLMGEGVQLLITIATAVAALPGADWRAPYLPTALLVMMTLGGLWLLLWRTSWRWWGIGPIATAVVIACFVPLPQAIVSDDGKMAVLRRAPGEYVLVASKRVRDDNFVAEQWARYLGVRQLISAEESGICSAALCQADQVVLLRDPNAMLEWCGAENKTILLPSAGGGRDCNVAVDTWRLYREGAAMVTHTGAIRTVAAESGHWPWSRFRQGD